MALCIGLDFRLDQQTVAYCETGDGELKRTAVHSACLEEMKIVGEEWVNFIECCVGEK